MTPIRTRVAAIALSLALGSLGASCVQSGSAADQNVLAATLSSRRMPDGKRWMTENLNVNIGQSYCYDDIELNCRRYGRLYTWEAAQRGCRLLGDGWRLPTNEEWRLLAKHYGGIRDDSDDGGRAAYTALFVGGSSGLNAVLGGRRDSNDGPYARLAAHGFYWTASETNSAKAWFYNFGQAQFLNRHSDGEKQRALSARCVSQ